MLIPELPAYLTSLGGEDYKGLIIGLFTVSALISRPFSGKLADTVGRIPIIFAGTAVCVLLGVLYPFMNTVGGFLALRLLHGFSTGFQPTGTTAYLADVVSLSKRGEALGYLGVSGMLGMSSGPPLGSWLANTFSLNAMFFTSSGIALCSVLVLGGIKETLPVKKKFELSDLAVWREPLLDPNVFPALIVIFLSSYCFGMVVTVIPDFSDHLGNSPVHRGVYFFIFTLASVVSRLVSGRASDIYGRVAVLRVALAIVFMATTVTGFATNNTVFYVGAVLFGLGSGTYSPTLFAWTIDLGNPLYKARSIATLFIGLEAGIFSGAVFSAFIYDNDNANFPITFLSGSAMALAAFIYLMPKVKREAKKYY